MSTSFETLYESVLSKLIDFDLGKMDISDLCNTLKNYIRPALVDYHLRRPELNNIDMENNCFNADLTSEEIEILADFMIVHYIDSNYIRTSEIMRLTLLVSKEHTWL